LPHRTGLARALIGPGVVPESHVFVMDNTRDFAQDSRVIGDADFVPVENVIGRVLG
jgi:hypothetical protein